MYNGIGLASVRGTATSGHVQSNAGHVRNSSRRNRTYRNANDGREENRSGRGGRGGRGYFGAGGNNNERHALLTNEALREGASSLALHEKKRRLEVRLMEIRDQLEERGWKDEEIEKEIQHEREKYKREEERREQQLIQQQQQLQEERQQQIEAEREDGEIKLITQGDISVGDANDGETTEAVVGNSNIQGESRLSNIKRRYGRSKQFKERGGFGGNNTQARTAHKEERNNRLRDAFGISAEKHKEGEAFDRELQETKRVEKKQRIEKAERKAERARIREEKRQKKLQRNKSNDGKKKGKKAGKR
eukprot:scaffold34754_cov148-Skeletonema_menzelii.AAC.3